MTYKNYMLALLTAIATFNYVDRMVLGVVTEDLRVDLQLTDTQLGFLGGMAFAVFYAVMGIPIARWADRGNRVLIITSTTVLWSTAVALCGTVSSFAQLLAVRVVVAVGEAGCIPPGFSLIGDFFTRAERPRALAIYGLAAALALFCGFFAGGWLNESFGWRATFTALGAPGLVLAALAWFTLKEPRKLTAAAVFERGQPTAAASTVKQPDLTEVCKTLTCNHSFRWLLLALVSNYLFGYGLLQWQPAFFVRSFGMATREIGTWLAIACGSGALIGTYLGGEWASRYAARDEARQLRGLAVAIGGGAIALIVGYLSSNPYLAFFLLGVAELLVGVCAGPLFAAIQTLVPDRMRAVAISFVYLAANLIGMGLGPLASGVLSDGLKAWAGDESLRYALALISPGFFCSAWFVWRASMTIAGDLASVSNEVNVDSSPPATGMAARREQRSLGLHGSAP